MIVRSILALAATLIVLYATVEIWQGLKASEETQIARLAESESYAARSRLVRNVDTMLRALRDVHIYWSTFGSLPPDQWASDASLELNNFEGIDLILWSESSKSLRFARSKKYPAFDHRPDEEEWAAYDYLWRKAADLEEERLLGPFESSEGRAEFEVYFVPRNGSVDGTLIAVIDARESLQHLLHEDSPGFAITVKARDTVIYQRGQAGPNLPESWTRSGYIENSLGAVWEVIHAPTDELARSMQTPAINAVLYAGIAIAVLMGLLLVESGRVASRARAANQARQELAELNRELEQQVAERTRELEVQSWDLMTITESVGHDLRNPLNAMSANVQLLDQQFRTQLGEDGLNIIDKVSRSISQMSEILDRLLGLSIVTTHEFKRERIDMTAMAEEIFEDLKVSEPGAAVDFFAEEVPDAMGEPMMVSTLLMNLLSNALKYTRTRSSRKIIFASTTLENRLVYYVQDNGIGFEPEVAERIFTAFERLRDDHYAEGLGLGLNIASRVVKRHGGQIWAEGRPNGGATFFFTLGEQGVVD